MQVEEEAYKKLIENQVVIVNESENHQLQNLKVFQPTAGRDSGEVRCIIRMPADESPISQPVTGSETCWGVKRAKISKGRPAEVWLHNGMFGMSHGW